MRFFLTLLLGILSSSPFACVINIVYSDVAVPPYYLGDGELVPENPGVAVELVALAAARIDCKLKWSRLPNKRVQSVMEREQADAMLLFSYNDERSGYAVYPMKDGIPDPAFRLTTLTYRVYVKEGARTQWDGKQFVGLDGPIGVNAGYSIAKDIAKLGVAVVDAPGTMNNLKKLQADRIAAYVMQDLPADIVIDEMNLLGISKLPIPYSTKDYYLPFSKKFYNESPALAQRLWQNIAEIRKTKGKELLKKYGELH